MPCRSTPGYGFAVARRRVHGGRHPPRRDGAGSLAIEPEPFPHDSGLAAGRVERALDERHLAVGADEQRGRRARAIAVGDDSQRREPALPVDCRPRCSAAPVRRERGVVEEVEQRSGVRATRRAPQRAASCRTAPSATVRRAGCSTGRRCPASRLADLAVAVGEDRQSEPPSPTSRLNPLYRAASLTQARSRYRRGEHAARAGTRSRVRRATVPPRGCCRDRGSS